MSNVMWIILSLSVSGSVIAGILFLLKPLLKDKVSKAFLYYAWLIVLMRMVLPISAPINAIDALVQKASVIEETVIEERVDAVVSERVEDVGAAEWRAPVQTVIQPQEPINEVQTMPQSVTVSEAKTADFRTICIKAWNFLKENLIVVWGAGALCVFLWFAVSYFRFSGKLNHYSSLPTEEDNAVFESLAGRSRVTMLYNSAVSTPLMIGVFNPRILVPEREYVKNGQKKQLESLLKHELMHYRRRDILYKWAAVIVSSLHWFNPLMPLIRREIAQECEFSCDEAVIRNMTTEEKTVYGETLLSFAVRRELPKGIAAATFGEKETDLKKRLSNIIAYHRKPLWIVVLTFVLVIALAGCAVITGVTSGKREPVAEVQNDVLTEETEPQKEIAADEEETLPTEQETAPPTVSENTPAETVVSEKTLANAEQKINLLSGSADGEGEYPRRYFDIDFDGEIDAYIELTMPYKEVMSILEELQTAGSGEIVVTGVNTGLEVLEDGTREPDQKWIRYEEYIENEINTIAFLFDGDDRLFEMSWAVDWSDKEYVFDILMPSTITAENQIPQYCGNEKYEYFQFKREAGYSVRHITRDPETRALRRVMWVLTMADVIEQAEDVDRNVYLLFPNRWIKERGEVPLLPENAISAEEAVRIAAEETGMHEGAFVYSGYAIYNGEYYHTFRENIVAGLTAFTETIDGQKVVNVEMQELGTNTIYCYVSMDGKTVYEGMNHYIG